MLVTIWLIAISTLGGAHFVMAQDDTACRSDVYGWWPVFGAILGASVLLSGVMMGVYASLKQIYGTSYSVLFGYSWEGKATIQITGILTKGLLAAALFSILGGICCVVMAAHEKAGDFLILMGMLAGAGFGVLYSRLPRRQNLPDAKAISQKLFDAPDIFRAIMKHRKSLLPAPGMSIVTGILLGMLTAGWLGWVTNGAGGLLAGLLTGFVVGGIAGLWGGITSMMTGWFPGGVFWGVAGGIAGYGGYYWLSQLPGFELAKDSLFAEGLGMGIAGAALGISTGCIGGVLLSVSAVVLTLLLVFVLRMVEKVVSAVLRPSLVVSRFKTIICNNCLRYTEPLNSWYEDGNRFCEHCHERVEFTHEPGVVRVVFGHEFVSKPEGRNFSLVNVDFEQKDQPLDISEVHLETKTADRRLIERFITYILNHPPKYGLSSVRVMHSGTLDELGDNLKNALCNNFEQIFHA